MNISRFFIDRPIFASVISVVIFLCGALAVFKLPISEYPEVSPPSIVVSAQFPGANPTVIAASVATPLEEQVNGVENMLYMYSQATTDGRLQLTVTFAIGTDVDLAQQLVQNRVSQALPRLPDVTRQLGVTVVKSSPDLTMVVHLTSPDNSRDVLYLRNYAVLNVKDQLARITGVGQVRLFGGGDYAMRVWLNPEKIAELGLTAGDVTNAIREQNIQVAAGVIGGAPYADVAQVQMPVNAKGRLSTPEEFGDIVIRAGDQGRLTKLKDVARIELGASEYALRSMLNNKSAAAIPIFAAPNANALDISDGVRKTMKELKKNFPAGVDYSIVYDPTIFVRDSINAVIHTLLEAIILVVIVVIVFLQSWRASLIPLLAVPVSIVGTFALMLVFGFSINVLSLFGMILAIGIVVDDAIIVVENVERNIEEGKSPREASYIAMSEVTSPIIATTLVLFAIFIPISFVSGLTGQFYKQFALTIAISTAISAFNSLTLSPALSALLLKPKEEINDPLSRFMDKIFGRFFNWFNRFFRARSESYTHSVSRTVKKRKFYGAIFAALLVATYFMFKLVPGGFVPMQDKQYLISFAQLPYGATLERTEKVLKQMGDIALKEPGVKGAVAFPGLSINGFTASSSAGIVFLTLDAFENRSGHDLYGPAIAGKLGAKFGQAIPDAFTAIFPPPPVRGLGTLGGFKLQIEDRTDVGYTELQKIVDEIQMKANQQKELVGVFSGYKINVPQLFADVDRDKAKQLGLNIKDIFDTLQIYLGSLYVNDFNLFGRTYQVIAQASSEFRDTPDDITRLKVRNAAGEMIPLGSVVKVTNSFGPEAAQRYNAYRAADLNGNAAPGYSSGEAQAAITRVLNEVLPRGMEFEWTDLTYQQILSGDTTMYVFPLCAFLVFLVLAALYESLTLPLAIIMIVPMALLAAIFGVWLTNGDNNIFTQISFFVLMGLATKNAILIVEFARELEHTGMGIIDAAVEACRIRLRPILMTSFAFIMGVLPMAISSGAGAEMRNVMGIAVFAGMLGVTFFGLLFTPIFYVAIRTLEDRFHSRRKGPTHPANVTPH